MVYGLMADLIVVLHFAFILFVFLGGFLTLRWPSVRWVHLPALVWGLAVQFTELLHCPLTPWELALRDHAGQGVYSTGFTEHYLLPLIHMAGLTLMTEIGLGVVGLATNVMAYRLYWRKHHR